MLESEQPSSIRREAADSGEDCPSCAAEETRLTSGSEKTYTAEKPVGKHVPADEKLLGVCFTMCLFFA